MLVIKHFVLQLKFSLEGLTPTYYVDKHFMAENYQMEKKHCLLRSLGVGGGSFQEDLLSLTRSRDWEETSMSF